MNAALLAATALILFGFASLAWKVIIEDYIHVAGTRALLIGLVLTGILLLAGRRAALGLYALVLLASLYHAKTFFELFPRVMPLLPAPLMIAGQWLGTIAVALFVLWLFGAIG